MPNKHKVGEKKFKVSFHGLHDVISKTVLGTDFWKQKCKQTMASKVVVWYYYWLSCVQKKIKEKNNCDLSSVSQLHKHQQHHSFCFDIFTVMSGRVLCAPIGQRHGTHCGICHNRREEMSDMLLFLLGRCEARFGSWCLTSFGFGQLSGWYCAVWTRH